MGLSVASQLPANIPQQTESPAASHRSQPWYSEYMAALFETDRRLMAERIKRAERLVVAREREIHLGEPDPREQSALTNALHALHALRVCLGL